MTLMPRRTDLSKVNTPFLLMLAVHSIGFQKGLRFKKTATLTCNTKVEEKASNILFINDIARWIMESLLLRQMLRSPVF